MRRPNLNSRVVFISRRSEIKGSDEARKGEVFVPIGFSALEITSGLAESCQSILESTTSILVTMYQTPLHYKCSMKNKMGTERPRAVRGKADAHP